MKYGRPVYSMSKLLNDQDFQINDYCASFAPHPQMSELMQAMRAYNAQHGIQGDDGMHSCFPICYPFSNTDRLLTMMKTVAVNFHLNDEMGRDIFKWLSPEKRQEAESICQRLGALDSNLHIPSGALPFERLFIGVLTEMKDTSPPQWFARFIHHFSYHIKVTHQDWNATTIGRIMSLEEYITVRCHLANMYYMLLLLEYSDGIFLDWEWLETVQAAKELDRCIHRVMEFAALSNDLFSFEHEVIDLEADCNLIFLQALCYPEYSLNEQLVRATSIVRKIFMEYLSLKRRLTDRCKELSASMPQKAKELADYLYKLDAFMQACWVWQISTTRYKRERSIWEETTIA